MGTGKPRGRPKGEPKYITTITIPMELRDEIRFSGYPLGVLVKMGLRTKQLEEEYIKLQKIREILQAQVIELQDQLEKKE